MYFYIIINLVGRVGFGITANPRRRLKDYTGMWGEKAAFRFLFYNENPCHCTALERIIKKMHSDKLLHIETWKTEWLTAETTVDEFYEFVSDLIAYRQMPIALLKENVLFDNDLKADL